MASPLVDSAAKSLQSLQVHGKAGPRIGPKASAARCAGAGMLWAKCLCRLASQRKAGPKFTAKSAAECAVRERFRGCRAAIRHAGTAAPNFRRNPLLAEALKRSLSAVDNTRGHRKCSPKFPEARPQILEVRPQFTGKPAPNLWCKPLRYNRNFHKDFYIDILKRPKETQIWGKAGQKPYPEQARGQPVYLRTYWCRHKPRPFSLRENPLPHPIKKPPSAAQFRMVVAQRRPKISSASVRMAKIHLRGLRKGSGGRTDSGRQSLEKPLTALLRGFVTALSTVV
ncbi:hypothetical protein ABID82_006924 [Methylobacterium sp. PvP062]|jgi:hypothetical protein|uniref:Uncharacterized protein n=1 Tax=Methylobacterium radiotolerans TaxID=31998 RepID=A0ABV2N8C0_9HYPH|nr:hypothetical protein [Methylobacterium sp. PvP105]MBP2506383.1 hypothetical protein [Methylobacterium sp. PvP109]